MYSITEVVHYAKINIKKLIKWKEKDNRKPLIIRGARQVCKSWIMSEFGKTFKDSFITINFALEPLFKDLFKTKNSNRLINSISITKGKTLTKDTLLILDEIELCPDALRSLKYFYEDNKDYKIICAGSLLGLSLPGGFPVGKVEFLDMGPLTFKEFLLATNSTNYINYIESINNIEQLPIIITNPLTEKLKTYMLIGGMPEVLNDFSINNNIENVENILNTLLLSYEADFSKHAPVKDVPKIRYVFNSLISQLAKENKKFIYSVVKPGARAREYEDALEWLINANILLKVPRITKPGIPLSAYQDLSAFKIYMNDVGLLRKHANINTSIYAGEFTLFNEFKGSLTENFVLQSLIRLDGIKPYYWTDNRYEVDFIIDYNNIIIPIEVKAGLSVTSNSLKHYIKEYNPKLAIRFSLKNLSLDVNILNIPLYLIDYLPKFIDLALIELNK